jgi:RimJ/RimL family protein N-acetyltransferase
LYIATVLVTLRDGTRVRIRPIRPSDKALLEDGLRRLSAESIRRRFLSAKPSFSAAELRYLTEIDGHDHVALVAVLDADPHCLAGVARSVRLPGDDATAELAIVVGDAWQGRGLGAALADTLAEAVLREGVRRIAATMAGDNVPARRLMRRIARRLEHAGEAAGAALHDGGVHDGVREVTVDLAA